MRIREGWFYIIQHWPLLRRCSWRLESNKDVKSSVCLLRSSSISCLVSDSGIFCDQIKKMKGPVVNSLTCQMATITVSSQNVIIQTSIFCFSHLRAWSTLASNFPQKSKPSVSRPGVLSSHCLGVKWLRWMNMFSKKHAVSWSQRPSTCLNRFAPWVCIRGLPLLASAGLAPAPTSG